MPSKARRIGYRRYESQTKQSENASGKYATDGSTLSTTGAVPLPRWGRLIGKARSAQLYWRRSRHLHSSFLIPNSSFLIFFNPEPINLNPEPIFSIKNPLSCWNSEEQDRGDVPLPREVRGGQRYGYGRCFSHSFEKATGDQSLVTDN